MNMFSPFRKLKVQDQGADELLSPDASLSADGGPAPCASRGVPSVHICPHLLFLQGRGHAGLGPT